MITDKEIQILKEMHFHGEISESEFKRRMERARTEEMEARENFMKAIVGNKEAPKTMTEQEAKLILNVRVSRFDHANDVNEALEVAISALEEIQQYRALGTVEEFKRKINDVKNLSRMYEKLNDQEVREYRELKKFKEIGTVKEFREAMEKQRAKTPYIWGDGYSDGYPVYDMYECPNCGENYEIDGHKYDFCPNCGQAINWEVVND